MAQPSYQTSPNPVCVIGSQFVAPYPIELIFVTNSRGDHMITDINHKIMFKVKPCNKASHEGRVVLDADDIPIVMIRQKIISAHSRWEAFKGGSKVDSEMIFSAKTAKIIQSKTNVHVFLANKTSSSKDSCDFKITGSWSNRNCSIYMGDSKTIIAQMHKMELKENVSFVKDKFMVKIYPYVDYAFVVTLIAILEAMKSSDDDDDVADQVMLAGADSVGAVALVIVALLSS